MQPDFEQSLDAQSEFIPIGKKKQEQDLGQSLVAQSEKIYFENASTINRQELEQAHKHLAATKAKEQGGEEESANQFLQVGKWKKAKESTLSKDMQNVKKQIDQIITQTKWKKKPEPKEEEVIADQSIAPEDTDEIQDQTQHDQAEEEEQQQEQEEEEEEEEQEEEESEEEEEEQSEESQQEQEQDEEEEQQEAEVEKNQEEKEQELPIKSPQNTVASKPSPKPSPHSEKNELSMLSDDDRTDTKSQMKKTEYLPSKWSKKGSQMATEDPWQRKQAILLRIAKLVS